MIRLRPTLRCAACDAPTDEKAADRCGLCAKCATEYQRDMAWIEARQAEEDARRVNTKEWNHS